MNDIKKFRKRQNSLMISGKMVIALGFWSVAKFLMYAVLKPEYFTELFSEYLETEQMDVVRFIVYIYILTMLIIDLIQRCYVGKTAQAIAKGTYKNSFYLVFTVIILVLGLWNLYSLLFEEIWYESENVAAIILEAISDWFYIDLMVCGIVVNKHNKKAANA